MYAPCDYGVLLQPLLLLKRILSLDNRRQIGTTLESLMGRGHSLGLDIRRTALGPMHTPTPKKPLSDYRKAIAVVRCVFTPAGWTLHFRYRRFEFPIPFLSRYCEIHKYFTCSGGSQKRCFDHFFEPRDLALLPLFRLSIQRVMSSR